MDTLSTSAVFPYALEDLYNLVMQAEKYPEISSYIRDVEVEERPHGVKAVHATLAIPGLPFAFHYGCELRAVPPGLIEAAATKSPFKRLEGSLNFTALPEGGTKVDCTLHYETGWNPLAIAASKIMKKHIDEGVEYARAYLAERFRPQEPGQGAKVKDQRPAFPRR